MQDTKGKSQLYHNIIAPMFAFRVNRRELIRITLLPGINRRSTISTSCGLLPFRLRFYDDASSVYDYELFITFQFSVNDDPLLSSAAMFKLTNNRMARRVQILKGLWHKKGASNQSRRLDTVSRMPVFFNRRSFAYTFCSLRFIDLVIC